MVARMKYFYFALLFALFSLFSQKSYAELQERNLQTEYITNTYYDTVLDVTWASLRTPAMNWWAANSFVDGLNAQGASNWRLPSMTNQQPTAFFSFDGSSDVGYNVKSTSSEFSHLYFETLNNIATYDATGYGPHYPDAALKFNQFPSLWDGQGYWMATEYASNTEQAWFFRMDGYQNATTKYQQYYVVAIHDGDILAVPEPHIYMLLILGATMLIFLTKKFPKLSHIEES